MDDMNTLDHQAGDTYTRVGTAIYQYRVRSVELGGGSKVDKACWRAVGEGEWQTRPRSPEEVDVDPEKVIAACRALGMEVFTPETAAAANPRKALVMEADKVDYIREPKKEATSLLPAPTPIQIGHAAFSLGGYIMQELAPPGSMPMSENAADAVVDAIRACRGALERIDEFVRWATHPYRVAPKDIGEWRAAAIDWAQGRVF